MEIKTVTKYIKDNGRVLDTCLGEITNLKQIGQGGNGLVYEGNLRGKDVAIKFLIENNQGKIERFKSEYFNVIFSIESDKIVKYINFDKIKLEEENICFIIMKKYEYSLKKYRSGLEDINWEEFKKLYDFLKETLKLIHNKKIIHRDLKPENVLVSEGKFSLTDFGIAKYDSSFEGTVTKTGERIGNREFSAPEQLSSGIEAAVTMDIYSFGQICHWFVYGEVVRGGGRKRINIKFKNLDAEIIDKIIDKCIQNNPENRFSTIEELDKFEFESLKKIKSSEKDPMDQVLAFNDLIAKTFPDYYNKIGCIENIKRIKEFVFNYNNSDLKGKIYFNTGRAYNEILDLEIDDDKIIINRMEFKVNKIWIYACDYIEYTDLFIIETSPLEPLEIKGERMRAYAVVNDGYIISIDEYNSGYFRIDGKSEKIEKKVIRERPTSGYDKIFLGTRYNSSIYSENDNVIDDLQRYDISEKILKELKNPLYLKKAKEVLKFI